MRIILVLAVATIGLGACKSEEQLKQEFRSELVSSCTRDYSAPGRAPAGVDPARFCACVADRALGNRSVADLRQLEGEAGRAAGQEAGMACLREMMPAAPATDANTAGPAQGSPPANEVAAEAVDEAADEVD